MEDDTKSPTAEVPIAPANPSPASNGPVMDVVPPVAAQASDEVAVEAEPESGQSPTATSQPETPAPAPAKLNAKAQKPGPAQAKTQTAPVLVITLAIVACMVLAGLAYYAYSKG